MAKKASIKKTSLSREDLIKQAPRLALVLRALRQKQPDITSDTLWENMLQRWSGKDLEDALKRFESSRKLGSFRALLQPLPRASKDGVLKADNEIWTTYQAVCRVFVLSRMTFRKRLREVEGKVRTRKAYDPIGHVRTFYSAKDISTFLGVRYLMDDDRVVASLEDECLPLPILAERLMLSEVAVANRLMLKNIRPVVRKNARNQNVMCYSNIQARRACHDLLSRPLIGEDGTLQKDDILWVSRGTLLQRSNLTRSQVMLLLASPARVRRLKIRSFAGKKINAFAFPDVKKFALAQYGIVPILHPLSSQGSPGKRCAGIDGTFVEDGRTWIGATKYASNNNTDVGTIKRRVKKHNLEIREGFTRLMIKRPFYCVEDLDRVCADLLAKRAMAKNKAPSSGKSS